MKQKEETKITTLCRLVAMFNSTLYTPKGCDPARVDVKITLAHNINVRLLLVLGNNTTSIYNGNVDAAIAFMAKSLCGNTLPDVNVTIEF